jgi:methylenetetrahydrofolate dehydrogenase (NADP+) / methenyltetrahydrofolate cyclohydrolase
MILINGKQTAETIKNEIRTEVAGMIDDHDKAPHLAAILVGDDPASDTYVSHKEKDCKSVGITSSIYRLGKNATEKELLDTINFINSDDEIHGLICQLPLPGHIDVDRVISYIDPKKDVDGFHPVNVGKMALGYPTFLPATPYGIIELLKRYNIETSGKHCVVIGRSNIVGTPLSILLSRKSNPGNATVTLCHSRTKDLKQISASADILIAAIGQPGFVTADMVRDGAVVIDVGIHRIPSDKTKTGFRLVGDVDFEKVTKKASAITPVPGGVGPMTRVALLLNTLRAFKSTFGPV